MDWRLKHASEDFAVRILDLRIASWIHLAILVLYLMFSAEYQLPRVAVLVSTAIFFSTIGKFYKWNLTSTNLMIGVIYIVSVVVEISFLGSIQILQEVEFTKGIMLDISMMLIPPLYIALRLSGMYLIILIERERRLLSITGQAT